MYDIETRLAIFRTCNCSLIVLKHSFHFHASISMTYAADIFACTLNQEVVRIFSITSIIWTRLALIHLSRWVGTKLVQMVLDMLRMLAPSPRLDDVKKRPACLKKSRNRTTGKKRLFSCCIRKLCGLGRPLFSKKAPQNWHISSLLPHRCPPGSPAWPK